MLVLSAANASPENSHLQALVATERERTRAGIRRCVERAMSSGELSPSTDAEGLATLAEALLVGMSVQARDGLSQVAIDAAVSSLLRLWDAEHASVPGFPATQV